MNLEHAPGAKPLVCIGLQAASNLGLLVVSIQLYSVDL